MVDDDVLNDDENQEDDDADRVVSADHKLTECLDHVSSGGRPGLSVQKNEACGRNVERKPEQRGHQQNRRKR